MKLDRIVFGIEFKNPVLNASGCLGFGQELAEFHDPSILGGLVTKAITLEPRQGNPQPRIVEFTGGMLNSIGLENPGVEKFIKDVHPEISTYDTNIIANVAGKCSEDYITVIKMLEQCEAIRAYEVNVSCPNAKGGIEIGTDNKALASHIRSLRCLTKKPMIIKLSPLVTDIASLAHVCQEEGADGLTLINTLKGIALHRETGKPVLGNVIGGLSGPCLKPLAIYSIVKVREKVSIPIIGCGGIMSADDVQEFFHAGADLVQVGTAAFQSPWKLKEIIEGLSLNAGETSTCL